MFVSEDPIGIGGGVNLYAYVQSDPVSYVDPLGKQDVRLAAGVAVGLGLGHLMLAETAFDMQYRATRDVEYFYHQFSGYCDRGVPNACNARDDFYQRWRFEISAVGGRGRDLMGALDTARGAPTNIIEADEHPGLSIFRSVINACKRVF